MALLPSVSVGSSSILQNSNPHPEVSPHDPRFLVTKSRSRFLQQTVKSSLAALGNPVWVPAGGTGGCLRCSGLATEEFQSRSSTQVQLPLDSTSCSCSPEDFSCHQHRPKSTLNFSENYCFYCQEVREVCTHSPLSEWMVDEC